MKLFFSFIVSLFQFLFEAAKFAWSLLFPRPERNHDLKASFTTSNHLLSVFNQGFCFGRQSLSIQQSKTHAIIIGGSGTGKSTSIFFPCLTTMHKSNGSFVVHDPSGELFKSAGFLHKHGYTIKILDFSNAQTSIGFNPLLKIKDAGDINKMAALLIKTTTGFKDPFWDSAAQSLLKTMIALTLRLEPQYHNLANVRRLCQMIGSNGKRINELVTTYGTPEIFQEHTAFLTQDPKVAKGILSTALTCLQIFADETVAKITSTDTFNFSDLPTQPVAIFIQTKVNDQQYYNVLVSIFFETLFKSLTEELPKKSDRNIYFLFDEAASGLRMPSLANFISICRKYNICCLFGIQDYAQLIDTYGHESAQVLMTNCFAKMFFTNQSHSTATMISGMLGRYTFEEGKGKHIRNLMEPDEVRMLPKDKAILILGNEKPVLLRLRPFYHSICQSRRMKIPMPPIKGDVKQNPTYINETAQTI